MELPVALKAAVEARVADADHRRMARLAADISERYREKTRSGAPLVSQADEALVYAAVRMPATYGATRTALACALAAHPLEIRSLMDAGAGTGAATWAAASLLDLEEITCLEGADAMLELGKSLMTEGPRARWLNCDIANGPLPGAADLVIASYMLNELSDAQRPAALEKLWNAAGRMLLLVEPGTPAHAQQLARARAQLIALGAHVAAPCPHNGECPMAAEDWCHFTCRIARSRLHKQLKGGEVPYEDEKFAYMAFAREKIAPPRARVLGHPALEKGRITATLCAPGGIEKRAFRKRDGAAYKMAKKLSWGDSIP